MVDFRSHFKRIFCNLIMVQGNRFPLSFKIRYLFTQKYVFFTQKYKDSLFLIWVYFECSFSRSEFCMLKLALSVILKEELIFCAGIKSGTKTGWNVLLFSFIFS